VIVGDGPERAALQREFGNLSSVTWRGVVNDEEKRRLLRSADLLIAPALFGESFGLVLLEAMAAETPVFASDIDGYRQAAGGCATLFAPGDERALATALTTFVRRESDVAAARAHAEQWSMSALVDHYDAIYADARERFGRRG
jgi:phosphatidylinositol alpha-mannosyltransferase